MQRLFAWATIAVVLLIATPAMAAIDEMVITVKGMSCAF
jgi:hypothetical protein